MIFFFFLPISFGPKAMSYRQYKKYKKYMETGLNAWYSGAYSNNDFLEKKTNKTTQRSSDT